jgi:hypothetical protein
MRQPRIQQKYFSVMTQRQITSQHSRATFMCATEVIALTITMVKVPLAAASGLNNKDHWVISDNENQWRCPMCSFQYKPVKRSATDLKAAHVIQIEHVLPGKLDARPRE